MTTTADLTHQVYALSESLKTTNNLISRLAKLSFQPGSEPLEGGSSARVDLSQDVHDSLKQLSEEFEIIKQEVEDFKLTGAPKRRPSARDNEEARLSARIVRLGEELTESRQRFRSAQVSAKFASDQAKRSERQAILDGYRSEAAHFDEPSTSPENARDQLFEHRRKNPQQKNLTRDEVLVSATSDVTAALRRTHDLLSTELSRSRFAQETLDQSTTALAQLGEDYSNLDTILSTSRNLIGTLLKSQKSDSWYLETAFYILITTLCWLIFRRLLYGPFFRLPLFIWSVISFFVNWTIIKPVFLFLSVTGILTAEPASSGAAESFTSPSRPPLIVHRSANSGPQAFPSGVIPEQGIPVGAGGEGAKEGRGPILSGAMSEKIGQMAESSAKEVEEGGHKEQPSSSDKEPVRRGDGTILQERGEEPPNPKKKMFEAGAEEAKHRAVKRDEL